MSRLRCLLITQDLISNLPHLRTSLIMPLSFSFLCRSPRAIIEIRSLAFGAIMDPHTSTATTRSRCPQREVFLEEGRKWNDYWSPHRTIASLIHFIPRYYQWELPYSCVELNLVHGDLLRLRSTTPRTPNWEAPMDRTRVVSGLYRQFNISLSIPYIPAKDIVSLIIGPSYPTRSAAVLLCRWRPRHCVRLRWKGN
jgi:hypothetical protein